MKTLLQINTVVNSGSTGRIAEEIGQTALANDWQSYIAYGRNERPSKSRLIKIGNNLDKNIHGIQTRLFDRHGLGSKKATQKLVHEIEKINPDIIHLHNLHGYYVNIEILFHFLSQANIPIVWTLHDCWPITGHCSHFDFVGCEKWKTECNNCPQKTEYPASFFFDRSRANYNLKKNLFNSVPNLTIVPVSNWLSNIVKQSFLSTHSIKVINNGIDTSVFCPVIDSSLGKKHNVQNQFIILGVASVWSPRKGLEDFMKLNSVLESNYQIILVGLSKNQLKQLPANIIGISKTENVKELANIYSLADVFINPTWEDNFPTTNLEAMSCGTPVISYNTGGSIESVTKETGIIVEKGDIPGLAEAIKEIHAKGKNHFSAACVARSKKYFSKDDRFQDYMALYNHILND